jgi:Ca-activated chloride channel family protein
MKNKDMFLIDDPEHNATQNWFESFEDAVINIVTSIGFIIALVLIAVNVEAAPNSDDINSDTLIKMSDIHRGSLLYKTNSEDRYFTAVTLNTDVSMKVSGMVVRTTLKQQFKNETSEWLEGIYVFPLPESAAVDHMKLRIGERTIEGQIKERKEAKRIYTQAKRQGKKASLVEQERPNMFTNSVANIGPGEIVTVEIEYQQILKYDNGQFKLRFPTTITPRYIPGNSISNTSIESRDTIKNDSRELTVSQGTGWALNTTQVPDASRITPPQNLSVNNPINIYIDLNSGFPIAEIKSTYHKIKSVMHLEGHYTVSLINENVPSDRDFELVWEPELGNSPKAALFSEPSDREDYHLVMIMPPENSENSNNSNQVVARDVTYIIDTSGSMHGESMRQAKAALQLAITRLRTFDKFNIIEFNSVTNKLFINSRPASVKNTFIAKNFVNRLSANGGTEMLPAIKAALDQNNNKEYIRQIIFLTDGSVGNEAELFTLIKNNLGENRLFTIAIGSSPNSYFMTKAAKFGRGTYTYIGKVSEVQEKMAVLFSKLEKPVMHDIKIQWPKDIIAEVWPKRLPDLYAGEPLVFTARVNKDTINNGNNKLLISGKRFKQTWNLELSLDSTKQDTGISVLWARNKIASIMDGIREYRNNSSSDVVKKLKEKIIKIALSHHLVSKYTSLVAVDTTPSRPVFDGLRTTTLANSIPKGTTTRQTIQGQYAQTATPAQLHLLTGLTLLILSLFLAMRQGIVFKRNAF